MAPRVLSQVSPDHEIVPVFRLGVCRRERRSTCSCWQEFQSLSPDGFRLLKEASRSAARHSAGRRGPLQRAATRDPSFARKPQSLRRVRESALLLVVSGDISATASVVLLVSGRWERAAAGSWPEIA